MKNANRITGKSKPRELIDWLHAFWFVISPSPPKLGLWWWLAVAFGRAPSWMPVTFIVAFSMTLLIFHQLLDPLLGNPPRTIFVIATWTIWTGIAFAGIALTCSRSIRNALRLGWFGVSRERWWFELSSFFLNAVAWLAIFCLAATFILDVTRLAAASQRVWETTQFVISGLGSLFIITGVTGYAISLLRWRIPKGRSFRGANFFLMLLAMIPMLHYFLDHWPPRSIWPDAMLFVASFLGFLGCFTALTIVSAKDFVSLESQAD